jgi:tRNA modification GTPase
LSSLLLEEGGSSDDEEAEFRTLMVYNKKDLRNSSGLVHALADSKDCCEVSCVTGEGIIDLELKISTAIKGLLRSDRLGGEDNALITRERHRRHVTQCVEHLNMFLSAALPMDAAAEELRHATLID